MARGKTRRGIRSALQTQFGTTTATVVLAGLLVALAVGWISDTVVSLWNVRFPELSWLPAVVLLVVLISLAFWLGSEVPRLGIRQKIHFGQCPALILFLSWPGEPGVLPGIGDFPFTQGACLAAEPNPLEGLVRGHACASWRMPLEAVRRHRDELRYVLVVPSADTPSIAHGGSYRAVDLFRDLLQSFPETCDVEVLSLSETGADYEELQNLDDVVAASIDYLRGLGFAPRDIVIDITGGQKSCSAIGGIRSLDDGLRFQYVSTSDYQVRMYDVSRDVSDS